MAKSAVWAPSRRGSEPVVQGSGLRASGSGGGVSAPPLGAPAASRPISCPVPGQPCLEGGRMTGPAPIRPDSPSALWWD